MKKQKFFRKSAALLGAFLLPAMSAALPCTAAPAVTLYGDINRDGAVNASDAACILEYAAAVGAGFTGTLEDFIFSNE